MNNLHLFEEQTHTVIPQKALSAKELTALNWYVKNNNLRLQLSNPPTIYFTRKGEITRQSMQLGDIMDQWKVWNEEDKKQRAIERKAERELEKRRRRV